MPSCPSPNALPCRFVEVHFATAPTPRKTDQRRVPRHLSAGDGLPLVVSIKRIEHFFSILRAASTAYNDLHVIPPPNDLPNRRFGFAGLCICDSVLRIFCKLQWAALSPAEPSARSGSVCAILCNRAKSSPLVSRLNSVCVNILILVLRFAYGRTRP